MILIEIHLIVVRLTADVLSTVKLTEEGDSEEKQNQHRIHMW